MRDLFFFSRIVARVQADRVKDSYVYNIYIYIYKCKKSERGGMAERSKGIEFLNI